MKDYYAVLELKLSATQEEIKEQYRFLVNAWHPDKFQTPSQKSKAEERVKEINEAYDTLKNPVKRKKYDEVYFVQSDNKSESPNNDSNEGYTKNAHEEEEDDDVIVRPLNSTNNTFWGKVACFFGYHAFGNWNYLHSNSCSQQQVCTRCGKTRQQELHVMGEWSYVNPLSCIQERICNRCKKRESRQAEHTYGGWTYIQPNSCEIRNICTRCGAYQSDIRHQWNEWKFLGVNTCEQISMCVRCGDRKFRKVSHSWSEWKYENPSGCGLIRHCIRCYESETRPPEHQWTQWERISNAEIARICRHCGKTESRYEPISSNSGSYSSSDRDDAMLNTLQRINEASRINSEMRNRAIENMSRNAEIIRRLRDDD